MPQLWLPFGAPIPGNGTTNYVANFVLARTPRFYRAVNIE
jgi:hypothetical protein